MSGAAGRKAVGPDTMGAVGTARCPVFLRLERGVSGYELESLGYKVTRLPKKARAAHEASQKRKRSHRYRAWYETQKERLGEEALREKWRLAKKRRREKALVGTPCSPASPESAPTGPGPAPTSLVSQSQ